MARQHDPLTNFSAGEISPQLRGRVDIDAYRHAAQTMRNFQPLQYGGARRRFGTERVRSAYSHPNPSRLIPFVLRATSGHFIELSHNFIRVLLLTDAAAPAYTELSLWGATSPYSSAQIRQVRFAQSGAFMVFAHPDHPPYALTRRADTDWWWRPLTLLEPPAAPAPILLAPAAGLSLSADVGTVTATASGATFAASDIGRPIMRGAGFGLITAVASNTSATVLVQVTFAGATGDWFIGGQPADTIDPDAVATGDPGQLVQITAPLGGFRIGDAGQYLFINDGVLKIESPSLGNTVFYARVVRRLSSYAASGAWRLAHPLFGGKFGNATEYNNGYPSAVAFNDQRLVFAALRGQPRMFLGSAAGDAFDFTQTADPADGFNWSADGAGAIMHLASDNDLLLLAEDGEYAAAGQDYGPVTNEIPRIRPQTTEGIGVVAPVKVGRDNVFVQRSGKSVIALGFDMSIQGYETNDLTLLAEHITGPGIVEIAYQRRPVPTLYCVRSDGKMACLTLDRKQRVTAWWIWETAGIIESVASVPDGDEDAVWMAVQRQTALGIMRAIERVQSRYRPKMQAGVTVFYESPEPIGFMLDGARLTDRGSQAPIVPFTITTAHVGQVVQVVCDGLYLGEFTANVLGEITIGTPGYHFVVGLGYTSTLEPMPAEIPSTAGSGMGHSAQAVEATVKVHKAIGGQINGADLTWPDANAIPRLRPTADLVPIIDRQVHSFLRTGDTPPIGLQGWVQDRPMMSIVQAEPTPFHVLAVVPKQGASGG
ncbi:MAG: hypothetical protein IT480_10750 [Gammaproteobacteria bacterium]|nr:hypothetical protein [Gammaproteobacteria bacterium]